MQLPSFTDHGQRRPMRVAGGSSHAFSPNEMASDFRLTRDHPTKSMRRFVQAEIIETRHGGSSSVLARAASYIQLGADTFLPDESWALIERLGIGDPVFTICSHCQLKRRKSTAASVFVSKKRAHPTEGGMTKGSLTWA